MSRWRAAMLLVLALLAALPAAGQQAAAGTSALLARLQELDILDPWMQREVLQAAHSLVQSSGRFSGVQVNDFPRPGWLSIYIVDSERIDDDTILFDGPPAVRRAHLSAGAWTHSDSGTILLDSAYWRRLTAATVLTQLRSPRPLPQALATVDAQGLAAMRRYWDEPAFRDAEPPVRRAALLMQGVLGYVLAHEIGHVGQPMSQSDRAAKTAPRFQGELDRARASGCDTFRHPEDEARRQAEREADLVAGHLVGRLCLAGEDGRLRHQATALGASWYFTATLSDRVTAMAVARDRTPFIADSAVKLLGPELLRSVQARQRGTSIGRVVALAFPSSHPPDVERMEAFERQLGASPCGSAGLSLANGSELEDVRVQMCRSLGAPR